MQAKSSSRPPDEREDKPMQRALLALLLHEFPKQLTREMLRLRGLGSGEPVERAILNLNLVGLLWCEGEIVLPTLAARHFDWLELA
jgi:hypothetical protein